LPRTGRPLSDNPKRDSIRFRVTTEEKEKIMAFAKEHEIGILELVRIGMDAVKKK